jgi:hypothetical protein
MISCALIQGKSRIFCALRQYDALFGTFFIKMKKLSKLIVLVVHRVKLIEVSLSIAQLLATVQYARAGGFPTYSPRGEILATRLLDQKKE